MGYWLDEVFEELKDDWKGDKVEYKKIEPKDLKEYVARNYRELWDSLPKLSDVPDKVGGPLKGIIPLDELDDLGWRWIENGPYGLGTGIFIPYWGSSYYNSKGENSPTKILPFCQVRHLTGDIRFNFPKDAQPRTYGSWILPMVEGDDLPVFIVEGTTDWVALWHCGIPAIAMPSSSATDLLISTANYCKEHDIRLVYAGDNDTAGDKLITALDNSQATYRVLQPPKQYNDWTDFWIAKGDLAIFEYCRDEVFPDDEGTPTVSHSEPPKTDIEKVEAVMGKCEVLDFKDKDDAFAAFPQADE